MGVVLGTFGVERHAITFTGQAAHSGSTPMAHRRDALGGVSKLHLAVREIAREARRRLHGRQRHHQTRHRDRGRRRGGDDARPAAPRRRRPGRRCIRGARGRSERIAKEEKIDVAWKKIWQIQPFPFHPELIELGDQAISEVCGDRHRLPSGPLHDAAEVCRTGVPTVMLFVQSLRGISHNKIEDTKEEHIELSVRALDRLANKTIAWLANCERGTQRNEVPGHTPGL